MAAWRRTLSFARRAWFALLMLSGSLVVVGWVVATTMPTDSAAGIVLGVAVASACWMPATLVREADGAASLRAGAEAEEWTAQVLRKVVRRRRRAGERWRVVHSVGFQRGDVDHVVVGPGGVAVVETKFRGRHRRDDERRELQRAAAQAGDGATRVRALVRQRAAIDVQPCSVVVVHGRGWTSVSAADRKEVDGVPIVPGSTAAAMDDVLPKGGRLPPAAVDAVADALARYRHLQRRTRPGVVRPWAWLMRRASSG